MAKKIIYLQKIEKGIEKMNSWKKNLMLSASLLSATLLVACGDGGNAEGGSGDGESAGIETLNIMAPTFETTAPPSGNEWEEALVEFTDQDVNIDWVPNVNYTDRMNVTLASSNIPHVMVVQGKDPGFLNSAEAGAFWELTDYLDDYENLSQYNEDILLNSSINGQVFGIPRERDIMRSTAMIRRDWLENLGLEVPTSVDELYEVLTAFKNDDPNQSGADDTVGMIIPTWYGSLDTLSVWTGAPNIWGFEDGEIVPTFATEGYIDSLEMVRKMVDEGLINTDFTTLSPDDWDSAMFNGDGGVIIDVYSRAMRINNLFNDENGTESETYVDITGTLTAPDGNEYGQSTDGYSGFLAISKQTVTTEEQLEEVLTFLDKLASSEGANLLSYGIEGVTYELDEDGYAVPMENDISAYNLEQLGTYGEIHSMRPEGELAETRYRLMEENEENAVYNAAAPLVSDIYARQGSQLDDIIEDARVRYIAGQISREEFDAEIERWYSSGGQSVIDELTEKYQELMETQE